MSNAHSNRNPHYHLSLSPISWKRCGKSLGERIRSQCGRSTQRLRVLRSYDVALRGASHCPPHRRKAVSSCAPASEIRKSASGSRPAAKACGETVSIRCLDILLGQGHALDSIEVGGYLVLIQDLDGPHAITPDGLQQVKRLGRTRPETLGHAAADRDAVRKQVVEVVGDLLALVDRQVLQIKRQRQGQRSAHVGSKPIRVVLQFHLSASGNRPSADVNPVGPDGQAAAMRSTPHVTNP